MITIFRILVAVATATLTKGYFKCDISQSIKPLQQCFGAIGQPLIFKLSNTPNTEIWLKKDGKGLIIKRNNQGKVMHYLKTGEFEFLYRGTFKLNKSMKNHSGNYTMEEFQSDGKLKKEVTVHVEIQAPVSKPEVSQMCLSKEQAKVNCSSLGDGVKFSLTLDGQPVVQTPGRSPSLSNRMSETPSVSSVSIMLDGMLTGNITCQAWNIVSKEERVIQLTPCEEVASFPILVVAVIPAVTILLAVAWVLGVKGLRRRARRVTVDTSNVEEEVIYSDVLVLNRRRENSPISQQNEA